MKFVVNHISKSGRLGCLSGMGNHPGQQFETPLLMLYTRGGNLPHITFEVLQMITKECHMMQMPLTTILPAFKSLENSGCSISEFVGMKEYPSYITPQDPAVLTPTGYNMSNKVAVWTKNGRNSIDPQRYLKMIEEMRPDMYLALCDGDTDLQSTGKRVSKAVTRSLKLFRECYHFHQASEALSSVALLAPIEGGYNKISRRTFIEELAQYNVSGYVIDGLHTNGEHVEEIPFGDIDSVISECVSLLPEDKLRVVHGAWNPVTLLQLVAAGCDLFDSSLPYLSTERGAALTFPYDQSMITNTTHIKSTSLSYEINLEDDIYFDNFDPLMKDCCCLACKQHTRAYIHHLLKSHELLGKVLLMIHNIHHYLQFFKAIRKAIQTNTMADLSSLIQTHCSPL